MYQSILAGQPVTRLEVPTSCAICECSTLQALERGKNLVPVCGEECARKLLKLNTTAMEEMLGAKGAQ